MSIPLNLSTVSLGGRDILTVTTDLPYHNVGDYLLQLTRGAGLETVRDALLPALERLARGEIEPESLTGWDTDILYLQFSKEFVDLSDPELAPDDPPNHVPLSDFIQAVREWCQAHQAKRTDSPL